MAFTAQDVKNLREQTGCGMMECKKALTDAEGDFNKAVEILREKGLAAATKKAGRIAAEGMVYATTCTKCNVGVLLEVNAETDFVAKNDTFKAFVEDLAKVIMQENPADLDALLQCKLGDVTVEASLQEKILVIGENIKIRRFVRFEGPCVAYVHGGGTHGVLVNFDTDVADKEGFEAYGKDVAMQIAAVNPTYVRETDVPADVIEKEKEIMMVQIKNDPKTASKPEQVIAKMVEGKVGKFYKENCLVDQAFVKDDKVSVGQYTKNTAAALGGSIEIVKFARFEKGEGLEKRSDDFANEVASMMK